jgi:uncharacterized membrane protein YcaP (DUF421 family)
VHIYLTTFSRFRTSLLARTLREQGITTIGKFASLTPNALEQIPYLKRPKYENAIAYLKAHTPNNMDRESPVSSQERRDMNAANQNSQGVTDQIEVENQNAQGAKQHQDVQAAEIKLEEETQQMMVSPSPEHGVPSLDENADAQPTRSPRKGQCLWILS